MGHCPSVLIVFALPLVLPAFMAGQGFGKVKKSITLERKLPAAVTLKGPSFVVKATAANAQNKEVAEKLQQVVETDLAKYNHELYVSEKPDTLIAVNVLNFSVPQPVPVKSQSEVPLTLSGKKNKQQQQQNQGPTAYKYTGTLTAAYQAKTRAGRFLDAENITVNFSQIYNTQGQKDDNAMNKAVQAVKMPWNKLHHKQAQAKEDEPGEEAPHTVGDVEQILMVRLTERIAARLVNTDEKVNVLLAKGGQLDNANKYADAQQWTPMIEALKTMSPFSTKEEDAYRLYNIGVANEALAYKAETAAAAKRYLEEASIDYGKAIDDNPSERYFIEPQNRIQTALEHFKKLNPSSDAAARTGTKKAPVKKKSAS